MTLSDNEIIKALPKVLYGGHGCKNCKYDNGKGDERCGLKGCKIARNALDLINRQKSELEKNEKIIKAADRLIDTQKAEIERLEEFLDSSLSSERNVVDNIPFEKSEVVKEFAEKLQDRCAKQDGCLWQSDIGAELNEFLGDKE